MGDLAKAEQEWRRILDEVPNYRDGWHGLGDNLLRQGKYAELEALAEKLQEDGVLAIEGRLLKAQLAASCGDPLRARRLLNETLVMFPDDIESRRMLCRILFEHGGDAEAEEELLNLARCDPTDASTYHNLGSLYMRLRRPDDAITAYEQALKLRPDSPATRAHLDQAIELRALLLR
jgi:tetratricopeptide (TPR) repeat protein